ncbi:hypothetical protein RFI_24922 [Reticulomyxa filosa]|uniref:Clp1 C-terminal domain-containing protein n=1 Tax=Reticulomyxa filosa TaxID=46433 RepID=X6MEM4_RETFI|nr:hypothetical protein RFI_24922 [Reticulomyxa filosa]|eukprot:ETO12453.1 hypothetical protein RFI_24922 [Reticulomyxa filosa]
MHMHMQMYMQMHMQIDNNNDNNKDNDNDDIFNSISPLYFHFMSRASVAMKKVLLQNQHCQRAGAIINTCGFVSIPLLDWMIRTYCVNVVVVLEDHTREKKAFNPSFAIIINRHPTERKYTRNNAIAHYFFGEHVLVLDPAHITAPTLSNTRKVAPTLQTSAVLSHLKTRQTWQIQHFIVERVFTFQQFQLFQILFHFPKSKSKNKSNTTTSSSSTPTLTKKMHVQKITLGKHIENHVVAATYAQKPNEILKVNVAGFLFVKRVDPGTQLVTCVSTTPHDLPGLLLCGNIAWQDGANLSTLPLKST